MYIIAKYLQHCGLTFGFFPSQTDSLEGAAGGSTDADNAGVDSNVDHSESTATDTASTGRHAMVAVVVGVQKDLD